MFLFQRTKPFRLYCFLACVQAHPHSSFFAIGIVLYWFKTSTKMVLVPLVNFFCVCCFVLNSWQVMLWQFFFILYVNYWIWQCLIFIYFISLCLFGNFKCCIPHLLLVLHHVMDSHMLLAILVDFTTWCVAMGWVTFWLSFIFY